MIANKLPNYRLVLLLVALLLAVGPTLFASAQAGDTAFAGQLAFTGRDNNIYLLDALDAEPLAVTNDASRNVLNYVWPTWSTDGRLAYFAQEVRTTDDGREAVLQIYVKEPNVVTPSLAYESTTETLTYAYWAPSNCPLTDNCRDLAVLVGTPGGMGVLRVRDTAPDYTVDRIGLGQPFYYSYSPDASQMLWTRFGRQIELYDTATNEVTQQLPDAAGLYQAPMWSPVDNRLLFSVLNDNGDHNLVIADGEDRQIIAENQRGVLWFAWSPDGTQVAYKLDLGSLTVVDANTGEIVAISSQAPVVAFWWSPDSQKIAYLTLPDDDGSIQASLPSAGRMAAPTRQRGAPSLTWNVLEVESTVRWVSERSFTPTRDMFYLIAYFDQFAQSHQVWSPDSRYVAFSEQDERGRFNINLLDATDPAASIITVAEGRVAVWSYHTPE